MKISWKSIASEFDSRHNSFDFVRFMLATLVIFYHTFPLGGFTEGDPLQRFSGWRESFGGVAVYAFFALSGFLITRSGTNGVSVWRFWWHRFLRILPGFWVCLIVTAMVIVPLIWVAEGHPLSNYFRFAGEGPFRYMLVNLEVPIRDVLVNLGLQTDQFSVYQLPTSTPFTGNINGSLWTLSHEIACYLIVSILIVTGILKKAPWVVVVLALALVGYQVYSFVSGTVLQPFDEHALFARNAMFFFVGASLFLYAKYVPAYTWLFVVCLGVLLASLWFGFYPLVYGFALPYLFIGLALKLPLTRFSRHGDFSYGLYIYGFPVQQALATLKLNQFGPLPYFVAALAVALLIAVLSYKFVEAPALRLKSLQLSVDALQGLLKRFALPSPVERVVPMEPEEK